MIILLIIIKCRALAENVGREGIYPTVFSFDIPTSEIKSYEGNH